MTSRDIYLRFRTGMTGTPMPSFADAASDVEMWDLANYVVSLARSGTFADGHVVPGTLMPWPVFSNWTEEDRHAVVVYLRHLPLIRHQTPEPVAGGIGIAQKPSRIAARASPRCRLRVARRTDMRRLALMMLLAATLSVGATAQETTATITGVTTDQSGAVVPGVTVIVQNTDNGLTRALVTNEAGSYTASLLPIGNYKIVFELQGFRTDTRGNITLHVNDRLQLDSKMEVASVSNTVEVTAATPLVQAVPQLQTTMASRQVQELPLNNRNFVQLATLAPGVSSDLSDEVGVGLTSTVSISINGARRNAVNWLVDGVSNVDVGSNITLLSTPTLESIAEFKIITNSYQAEWPRSGGGIVNVVTKSGSNRYAGSVYEFLRSDKLNANSFFRNLSPNPNLNSTPAPLKYNNFGATLGGPAIKNKLFFFYSQEFRRITRAPSSLTAQVVDPLWLSDPTNSNYVAPALRDPNAVKLLALFPAPNATIAGTARFVNSAPNINNTRQEVARVD